MKDSSKETDNWFAESKKEHKDLFSELDVLLRALDRFFYIENLPIVPDDLPGRNFYDELSAVRNVIFRVLGILEVVIPESKKNAYWFQKFAESKFLTDRSRDVFRGKLYKQETPEKGVYILYDLCIHLKGILTDLLRTGQISYLSYTNIGQLISKEIRDNNFLNPFRKDMNPEFDLIENPEISEIVRSIRDKELKKYISLLYLYLFRLLRYLNHVDIASQDSIALHSSLLILILLRSEITMLNTYCRSVADAVTNEELKLLLKSVSYQFTMEMKRVYLQELREILRKKAPQHFRGKIENCHGILTNLIEQSIVQITQFYRPDIQGRDIFESFTAKLVQSIKLREDLFVLHRFLMLIEEKMCLPEERPGIFKSIQNFMQYFESFTFKLLRYDDYDEFQSFFSEILSLKESDLNKALEKIHNFKIFLETTLRQIANRSELRDKPIDMNQAEEILKQYF
jgi:hypothetical protein